MARTLLINALKKKQTVLLHGPTGVGKSHLLKNLKTKFKNYTFHLYCPLEKTEFESIEFSLINNPNQNLILDNLEDADNNTINKLISFIKKKKEKSLLILVCSNIYERHLKKITNLVDVTIKLPPLKLSDAISFAQKKKVQDDVLELIIKMKPLDFRQLIRIIEFNTRQTSITKSEENTFIGRNNCFKVFEWLLGKKTNANLEHIVKTEPYFYINAFKDNYLDHINSINEMENISNELSTLDTFSTYSEYRDTLFTKLNCNITHKKDNYFNLKFPRFNVSKNTIQINFLSHDHVRYLCIILNHINTKRITKDSKQKFLNLTKKYNLSVDAVENILKNNTFETTNMLKQSLKKIMLS